MFSTRGAIAAGVVVAGVIVAGFFGYTIVTSNSSQESAASSDTALLAPQSEETEAATETEITTTKADPEIVEQPPVVEEPAIAELVFSVLRVEPDGSAVIAGSGPAQSEIRLLDGGALISSTQSGDGGDFAFVLDNPLRPGPHELSLEASLENGQVIASAESGVINVPEPEKPEELAVLVSEPGEASRILVKPEPEPEPELEPAEQVATLEEETGAQPVSESGEVDQASEKNMEAPKTEPETEVQETFAPVLLEAAEIEGDRFFLAGTGEPETTINVYLGDEFIGSTIVADNGAFLFDGTKVIAPGRYKIRADMLAKGQASVLARAEVELIHQPVEPQIVAEPEPEKVEADEQIAQASIQKTAESSTEEIVETTIEITTESVTEEMPEAPAGKTVEKTEEEKVLKTGSAVIIRRGDNLWRIAKRNYGAGIRYTTIFDANRDQIRNPDLIFPGQVFKIPEDPASGNISDDRS